MKSIALLSAVIALAGCVTTQPPPARPLHLDTVTHGSRLASVSCAEEGKELHIDIRAGALDISCADPVPVLREVKPCDLRIDAGSCISIEPGRFFWNEDGAQAVWPLCLNGAGESVRCPP